MIITIFVNDKSEFRMRLQKNTNNRYETLMTLNLTDVFEKDIYTYMRNAGFERCDAQNFSRRLKNRFDTKKFKLAVSDCKNYIFYLSTRYAIAFINGLAYVASFSLSDPKKKIAESKFSKVSVIFPGKQAYFLGNRRIESVLSISELVNYPCFDLEKSRKILVSTLNIDFSVESDLLKKNETSSNYNPECNNMTDEELDELMNWLENEK